MDSLTVRLLDAVKQRHGLTSDYQLAKLLCMGTSGIYGYRAGRSQMSNDIALRVAAQHQVTAGGSRLVTQRTADVVPARLRWRI